MHVCIDTTPPRGFPDIGGSYRSNFNLNLYHNKTRFNYFSVQKEASECLYGLIKKCLMRNPNPNTKVLKNLCSFLCCDKTFTPLVGVPISVKTIGKDSNIV